MREVFELLGVLTPQQPVEASDGTLWRSAWAAFLHDLVELKWHQLLPTLQDAETITKTRCELRLSRAELAKAAGISESLLTKLERNERTCTASVAEQLWYAMYRISEAQKHAMPDGLELLIRLELSADGGTTGVTTIREKLEGVQ